MPVTSILSPCLNSDSTVTSSPVATAGAPSSRRNSRSTWKTPLPAFTQCSRVALVARCGFLLPKPICTAA
jgi:hypothetical protein